MFSRANNILVHQPSSSKTLKDWQLPDPSDGKGPFDIGVVVSFGYLLRPHILDKLKHGAINMHPSLLPKYRGPAPMVHTLLNGDQVSGVTIIDIHSTKFDAGKILMQVPYAVPPSSGYEELSRDLSNLGATCILETLKTFHSIKPTEQDASLVSHAPKLGASGAVLNWHQMSAVEVLRRWKALHPRWGGISTTFQSNVLKLIQVSLPTPDMPPPPPGVRGDSCDPEPGEVRYSKSLKALWIRCSNDWIIADKLQIEKRKVQTGAEFANGYRVAKEFAKFS